MEIVSLPLLIIAIALTLVYWAYTIITDKVVGTSYSYSDSWYSWGKVGYSAAFILFLVCIAAGLIFVIHYGQWETYGPPICLIVGTVACYAIGIYANFKQNWKYSLGHNIFSALTFALVHVAWGLDGNWWPLFAYGVICVPLLFAELKQKTTVLEAIGIGLAIMGVYQKALGYGN